MNLAVSSVGADEAHSCNVHNLSIYCISCNDMITVESEKTAQKRIEPFHSFASIRRNMTSADCVLDGFLISTLLYLR